MLRERPPQEKGGIPVLLEDLNATVYFRFGNAQHTGGREQQQDSFGYSDLSSAEEIAKRGVLAVLADGMGGLPEGTQTSEFVVNTMLSVFPGLQYDRPVPGQLEHMVAEINGRVCENFVIGGQSRAGSTLAAALIYKTRLFWVCVGDSRIYICRKGALYQLNEDHNYLAQLLGRHMRGECSLEEAKRDPQKDALTSYIGHPELPYIDFNKRGFAVQRGDVFLLCSDGVYNALNNAELIGCLRADPQHAAGDIVKAALHKRIAGQDNLTAMVIEYK